MDLRGKAFSSPLLFVEVTPIRPAAERPCAESWQGHILYREAAGDLGFLGGQMNPQLFERFGPASKVGLYQSVGFHVVRSDEEPLKGRSRIAAAP